jgi:hypothetical protein
VLQCERRLWQEDHLENDAQPGERGQTELHELIDYACHQVLQEHRARTEQTQGQTPEREQAYRAFI